VTVTFSKDFANPFASIDPDAFLKDLKLVLVGAYVAIREAVKGFEELDSKLQMLPLQLEMCFLGNLILLEDTLL
jgi:hypothetical protein